ncbi:VUT family protein [Puniceicoccales bacterium CK1056]|uniref:VUT family protein n=1 Tax=Oceanipulchritudo coccoides TaxID=2706888 RepID=A0A6B2LZF9_9BACT|nr:VUT family protein [Oceanipulchritudo coccoides]NDV62111.1 VUT family protein [Oceanipulchritudo coccoides]
MRAAIIYTLAILVANLTATLFLPFEIAPGTGILVSVGTLVFGITFTQRDRMHSRGRRFVYAVIGISAVLNLFMLVSFSYLWGQWVINLFDNREWAWLSESAAMLKDNGWRVFLASFLAIIIAESADTEVFHYYRDRSWMTRVFRSNAVSIPVDSILFNLIAFAGSSFFPLIVLIKVILGEIVSKFLVGLAYAWLYPKREAEKK